MSLPDEPATRAAADASRSEAESAYAWTRLAAALLLSTIGGVGMWSVIVALPAVQAEFGVARSDATLPYTMTMLGFGVGGVLMGRLSDRFGILLPVVGGTLVLGLGYVAASAAVMLWQFTLAQALLIGAASSATFAPLLADTSLWFGRRRGVAIALFSSGSYLAGTVWPPIVQAMIAALGWRQAYVVIALTCVATMLPLAAMLRRRAPAAAPAPLTAASARRHARPLGFSPAALQALLVLAGLSCCVAMSMPQVHIVAHASDLGHGAASGAQMLSLMLGFGIVSRVASGFICDRIGGVRTLLASSVLQMIALVLFMPFESLGALYLVSAVFGLVQGGLVPSYTVIIREYFPAAEAGTRVSMVMTATLLGMALGGWMTGAIYDLTGSYQPAFVNGILWNVLNVAIAAWLLRRSTPLSAPVSARA
jgi:MFS family permease